MVSLIIFFVSILFACGKVDCLDPIIFDFQAFKTYYIPEEQHVYPNRKLFRMDRILCYGLVLIQNRRDSYFCLDNRSYRYTDECGSM